MASATRFGRVDGGARGRFALLLMLGVVGCLIAPPLAVAGPRDAVAVEVLENSAQRIVLRFQVGACREAAVNIDGIEYTHLILPQESVLQECGAPELPRVCRSVIIPDDAEMAVRVVAADYHEIEGRKIAPSKGVLYRDVDPAQIPHVFGAAYTADAFFPGRLAELGEPYILRDHRGVVLQLQPLQYNPVSGVLRVYTDVTVEVVPTGPGRVNVLDRSGRTRSEQSLSFDTLYRRHFLNYAPDLRYTPLDEYGGLLIICYDEWLANVQPLVAHKNAIGISTAVVGVSTIGNNATAIKNYIQNAYNTGNLAFVLLVGDAAQVATPTAYGSDPTYALLAGADHYPDIIVGRFSAETAAHVDTQVQRTIEYETLPAVAQPWFTRGTGIASAEGAGIGDDGEADWVHMENMRPDLLGYGYTIVDQIYDPGATAAQVSAALNAGRGIVNYCGHGTAGDWTTTGFSSAHVDALTNDNMLPFIVSVACNNGQFVPFTCFAEAWMRATRNGEPIGAIGTYMSSVLASWTPPMAAQDEFVDLLVAEAYYSFGALCYAGSCRMMDDYPGGSGAWMFDTWHLFGDPSLRVFGTAPPPPALRVLPQAGLTATGPVGGPFTPSKVYTLTNLSYTTPIDYSVSKTRPWVSLSGATTGTLAGGASTTITVSINAAANTLASGVYSDTVSFVNTTNHDGDTTRGVTLRVSALNYSFPLDTDPGWTRTGQWAFGQPTGQGGGAHGNPDPANGATGANVFGVNLNGDYSTSVGGPYYVTTGALNLTNRVNVTLKFMRWLNTDRATYVSAKVEVSNDGAIWTNVWANGTTAAIADSAWSQFTYDISSVADNQPTVYLRWSHQVVRSGAYAFSGWNIDDVEIWAVSTEPPPPGDLNGDGVVDIDDFVIFGGCMAGPDVPYAGGCDAADLHPDGDVDLADFAAFQAAFGGGE